MVMVINIFNVYSRKVLALKKKSTLLKVVAILKTENAIVDSRLRSGSFGLMPKNARFF